MGNLKEATKITIGLEIHITLKTKEKIFNYENTYQGESLPNSKVSSWELGYLGSLPIINPETVRLALKLANSLEMKINSLLLFDRKIYNYFDLPKGYQITQQQPLANNGFLPIIQNNSIKKIPISSIHLEEDTAKSLYHEKEILLDFNRAGNPLIELVTAPVFHDKETVLLFLQQLQNLLRYLEISETKMEKGQLRVDLNYSLIINPNYVTPRYEVKNLNSFRNLERALEYEIAKHQQLFACQVQPPFSQTLGFNEEKQITITQREKTNYYYLPEVNIPPIKLKKKEIAQAKKSLPCLPWKRWEKLKEVKVNEKNALLVSEKSLLMNIFNFLEKKLYWQVNESNEWIIFFLNFLSFYFSEENFWQFKKRCFSYWQLFHYWKQKKISKEEISLIAEKLAKTRQNLAYLIKKHHQKKVIIDQKLVNQEITRLWIEENLEESYLLNCQKVQNYLLGRLKKKYPSYSVSEIIKVISDFLQAARKFD